MAGGNLVGSFTQPYRVTDNAPTPSPTSRATHREAVPQLEFMNFRSHLHQLGMIKATARLGARMKDSQWSANAMPMPVPQEHASTPGIVAATIKRAIAHIQRIG